MHTNNNTPKTANLPSKAHSDDTQEDESFTMVSYRRSSNTSTRAAHARNKKTNPSRQIPSWNVDDGIIDSIQNFPAGHLSNH